MYYVPVTTSYISIQDSPIIISLDIICHFEDLQHLSFRRLGLTFKPSSFVFTTEMEFPSQQDGFFLPKNHPAGLTTILGDTSRRSDADLDVTYVTTQAVGTGSRAPLSIMISDRSQCQNRAVYDSVMWWWVWEQGLRQFMRNDFRVQVVWMTCIIIKIVCFVCLSGWDEWLMIAERM